MAFDRNAATLSRQADAPNDLFPLPDLNHEIVRARVAFKNTKIVGLHAGAQSGKDTASKILQAHGFLYTAFSTRGKAAAQQVYGLTDEQTWSDEAKEIVIPHLNMTPREIFQRFLTEVCREHISDDIWIRAAIRDTVAEVRRAELAGTPYKGIVFQDVREEAEADLVRAVGGTVWHLKRAHNDNPADAASTYWRPTDRSHSSEVGIAVHPGDIVIDNNRSIEIFRSHVTQAVTRTLDGDTLSDTLFDTPSHDDAEQDDDDALYSLAP